MVKEYFASFVGDGDAESSNAMILIYSDTGVCVCPYGSKNTVFDNCLTIRSNGQHEFHFVRYLQQDSASFLCKELPYRVEDNIPSTGRRIQRASGSTVTTKSGEAIIMVVAVRWRTDLCVCFRVTVSGRPGDH